MMTKFTQVARVGLCFVFLTGLFGRCSMPDHERLAAESCSGIREAVTTCKNGYELLAIVNQKTNVRTVPTTKVSFVVADLESLGGECFYGGNLVVESTATSVKVNDGTSYYEYGCAK
ncbi:hypothetical protein [Larkinella rosea]|uniref:Uncharacterized protein n=1 Tax=Larkinella rosea TaxID=2025312 RepID=A0A3P1BTR5_9BACT|nr:hypothetical protein [Larkinella rosea]RRB04319.1 hypothetical protein EHT25_12470 [Larkinella rosea]